jgi:L-ascorbate metabolism protein UlaG (beta-lactamase superfamily)
MMRITYHGQSCVEIESGQHRLIIDPFLTGNPLATTKAEDIDVQYILVTHGHNDHVGDTVSIAKSNSATVIAPNELADYLDTQGVKTHGMGLGGGYNFDFGRVKLTLALHGSSYTPAGSSEQIYTGMPCGFLLLMDGKTIYHAGDTALTYDMKLLSEMYEVDLAFLPIGDNYTMGPDDARVAARFTGAKHVVPIHYNTFPVIRQDPQAFVAMLEKDGVSGTVLAPSESMNF